MAPRLALFVLFVGCGGITVVEPELHTIDATSGAGGAPLAGPGAAGAAGPIDAGVDASADPTCEPVVVPVDGGACRVALCGDAGELVVPFGKPCPADLGTCFSGACG